MGELSERFLEVQVGEVLIRGAGPPALRVTFKATKSLKPEPNTCDVTIYNLSPSNRAALTKLAKPVMSLTAGYQDDKTQIFYGQAVHVQHERIDRATIATTISTTDSGDKLRTARIHQSFGARTKTGDVLLALVKALGLKPGNATEVARKLNLGKSADLYVGGVTLSGHAPYELQQLCRSAGLEWSVQDGTLQILDLGAASANFAILLSPENLTGSPSVSNKGVISGRTLIQRDFLPGRQVQIRHEFVNATGRIEKCTYSGDTWAEDWSVDFETQARTT
jgi:hypothetical protein